MFRAIIFFLFPSINKPLEKLSAEDSKFLRNVLNFLITASILILALITTMFIH